jgi:hypothetical protein
VDRGVAPVDELAVHPDLLGLAHLSPPWPLGSQRLEAFPVAGEGVAVPKVDSSADRIGKAGTASSGGVAESAP